LEYYGGAEVALTNLGIELARLGHEVILLSGGVLREARSSKKSLSERLREHRFKVISDVNINLKMVNLPSAKELMKLYYLIKWCDVIYFNECPGLSLWSIPTVLISKLLRKPVIATHHDSVPFILNTFRLHNRLRYVTLRRLLLVLFDAHHVVSKEYGEFLRKLGCRRLFFVPNGVRLRRTENYVKRIDSDRFEVLFIGRLSFEKGIDHLYHIIEEFNIKYPSIVNNIEFHIFGDGPQRSLAIKLSKAYKNVSYHGFLQHEKLTRFYSDGHLLIMTSRSENMPLTLIEAQAFGLPIVSFETTTLGDLVKEPLGKLVKLGDDQAFVKCVKYFYDLWKENPKDYSRLQDKIEKSAAKYDMTIVGKRMESLLKRVTPKCR
jgi:glycosyltransferase involved in cell wall biosynthesis